MYTAMCELSQDLSLPRKGRQEEKKKEEQRPCCGLREIGSPCYDCPIEEEYEKN